MRYVTSFERLTAQETSVKNAHKFIVRALELRFENVPPAVAEIIEAIEDLELLDSLHDKAITVESLATFEELLEEYE